MRGMRTRVLVTCAVLLLAACAHRGPEQGATSAERAAALGYESPPPPAHPSLSDEQRRLADLFRGTPVVFAMQKDGSLRVSVPLRYSFDRGRHAVKPPLGAVLERVAKSQRREPTRLTVMAPTDPGTRKLLLGTERASSARDYMVARGVDATRFSIGAAGSGDVIIVVAEAAH
jgi:outer membrane protein OmpA-like peptidoglycan-associated protein